METRAAFPAAVIARLLNITERRLQQLAKEGVVPKAGRGRYPLAACVTGYVKYLQERVAEQAAPDALELNAQRARLAKEQADKTALENAVLRGELIRRDHMVEVVGRAVTAFRARLLAACASLAPRVNPAKPAYARDLIEREITEALAEFAGFDPGPELGERAPDVDGAGGDPPAATAADGQRVGRRKSRPKPRK